MFRRLILSVALLVLSMGSGCNLAEIRSTRRALLAVHECNRAYIHRHYLGCDHSH